ncbi:MAG: ATP-binding cassette domain-containing protein [Candidatus Moduliflexus flocculans]|nr:ATP-binding cassette domain-containing protein [Candidatus Moduliflexus flocculans]
MAGANGSGKSTLIRCLNGLVVPPAGTVAGGRAGSVPPGGTPLHPADPGPGPPDPPDQIVASVVEEDAAFGLENLGVPRAEMVERVRAALEEMGLARESASPTGFLSAGQQQRLAVAGALVLGLGTWPSTRPPP